MTIHENDLNNVENNSATYCPEDNKLRLYMADRVERSTYDYLRAQGWKATPKQDCAFVATWSPTNEDIATKLIPDWEEIGDEDYSPQERAADRAERFAGYLDKRRSEALGYAEKRSEIENVQGYQNPAKAARIEAKALRIDAKKDSQWSKAEYWDRRTAGVISSARYKSEAHVRRARILRLEAEQRKVQSSLDESLERWASWEKVLASDDIDRPIPHAETSSFIGIPKDCPEQLRRAYWLVSDGRCWGQYTHPTTGKESSLYTFATDPVNPLTVRQLAELWFKGRRKPGHPESGSARWLAHYDLRIAYENAMLGDEGGKASDNEMQVGGWYMGARIVKVQKSPVTKLVTSVTVKTTVTRDGVSVPCEKRIDTKRHGASRYKAPTEAEIAEFLAAQKAEKKAAKETAPPKPSLINPTLEDAQKLQDVWNAKAKARAEKSKAYTIPAPREVLVLTQAQYTARSSVGHGGYGTIGVNEHGHEYRSDYMSRANGSHVFNIRQGSGGTSDGFYSANRVVCISDKPQKPLPWALMASIVEALPTPEKMAPRLPELQSLMTRLHASHSSPYDISGDDREMWRNFEIIGYVYHSSSSQWGPTDLGHKVLKESGVYTQCAS